MPDNQSSPVQQKKTLLKTNKSRLLNPLGSGTSSSTYTRSTLNSVSRKSVTLGGDSKVLDKSVSQTSKHNVRVFDDMGKDVTPCPLYQPEPGTLPAEPINTFPVFDTPWGFKSQFQSTAAKTVNSTFVAPFTQSVFGSNTLSRSSFSTIESISEDSGDISSRRKGLIKPLDPKDQWEEEDEQLTEEQLDEMVHLYLTESETMWLLDLPPVYVSTDSEEADEVRKRNAEYTELCQSKAGNDKYMERFMQTFNGAAKCKMVQTNNIVMLEKGNLATTWDIYDSYLNNSEGEHATESMADEIPKAPDNSTSSHLDPDVPLMQGNSDVSSSSLISSSSSQFEPESTVVVEGKAAPDPEQILKSDKLLKDLLMLERMVLQNIYQPKLAAYRGLPVLRDPDSVQEECTADENNIETEESPKPHLELLWVYACELTTGRTVNCMTWNKKNTDLLAVGYGQFNHRDQKLGLICGWSLRNPTWPGRVFHCDNSVTALDFSACNPSQLAAGFYNGGISIYNVSRTEGAPVFNSRDCLQKHMGPVWQVKWTEHENSLSAERKGETPMSVSADGRICKWFIGKNLSCTDLMKLKRLKNQKRLEKKRDILISRLDPGLCGDVHHNDPNIYLVGTEEGLIHKCSRSYNEQFLETYAAHIGPVYRVMWSPFYPDVFLSCSADWTIQLWRQDLRTPVLAFTSIQTAVLDVMWSPNRATLFGAVHEDRVEIWDLEASILYPTVVKMADPGVKLSTLLFAPMTDCVLVGDSEGGVSVYKIQNLSEGEGTKVDTLKTIIKSTLASKL